MKKIIVLALAALGFTYASAQTENSEIVRFHKTSHTNKAVLLSQVKDITFEKITPLKMDVDFENIKSDEYTVDFKMPAGCKRWFLKIATTPLTGTEAEKREQVIVAHNNEFTESKYFRMQNAEASTTYYFYMLLFDEDDVAVGLSEASVTTLAPVSDEFNIAVSEITSNNAKIEITPKDENMRYYRFLVTEDVRQQMIARNGSIQAADLAFWKEMAQQSGVELDQYITQNTKTGFSSFEAKDFLKADLKAETKYYAYCYGVEPDGTFTTGVYEQEFITPAAKPSDNVITANITKTYTDGCDIDVKTTNNDPYFISIQKESVWENLVAKSGSEKAAAQDLVDLILSHGGDMSYYIHQGNYQGKLQTGMDNTDCVVVICGYDGGVTTAVQALKFRTVTQ